MQILEQFDGTIEWKATERPPSDWAKQASIPPTTEQSEGASYALEPYWWYHKRVHEIGWYLKGGPNLDPPFDGTICGYKLFK